MKRIYNVIITCFIICGSANAQNMGLNIGDQVPDFEIPKIINSNKGNVKLSDFKDQLLILDFWNTGCTNCILALPKMDSLQKKFGVAIKILPVTDEAESRISSFWKVNHYTKRTSLPSVVEDKILKSYFKFKLLPHEVWIYKGKVVAVTSAEYVESENIEKVLSGVSINWPVKNDFYVFDSAKTLFHFGANQENANSTLKYSGISNYKPGVNNDNGLTGGSGIIRDMLHKTIRAYFLNQPIYNSYLIYWSRLIEVESLKIPNTNIMESPNTVIWEVADKNKFIYRKQYGYKSDWLRKNAICFESVNPDTGQTDQDVAKSIIADLNQLLGLNARWEKRKENVLILIKTGDLDKFKSKKKLTMDHDNLNFPETYTRKGNLHQFRDTSIDQLAVKMNGEETNPYVFDESGYKGQVDMDLNFSSWTDISGIRKALAPYGLDLKTEERLIDKFVITEVNGGLLSNQPRNMVQ